jgi:copper(I)-binding protein
VRDRQEQTMIRTIFLALAVAVAIGWPATAGDVTAGSLKISAPWARATPKGASVGGGYLSITNTGNEPDRLIGGSAAVSKRFEVHSMTMENGVMKMRPVSDGLEIKPGQTIDLKPGGYHVMFIDLNEPLKKGDRLKVTLEFARAGKVDVDFTVEGIGGMPMKHGH